MDFEEEAEVEAAGVDARVFEVDAFGVAEEEAEAFPPKDRVFEDFVFDVLLVEANERSSSLRSQ